MSVPPYSIGSDIYKHRRHHCPSSRYPLPSSPPKTQSSAQDTLSSSSSLFFSSFSFQPAFRSFTSVHGCTRTRPGHSITLCISIRSFGLPVNNSGVDPHHYRARTHLDRNLHIFNLLDVRRRREQLDYPCFDRRSPKPSSGRPARTTTLRTGQQARFRR